MQKGFTLIETLITSAILSIMLLFGSSFATNFLQKQKLSADVSKVLASIALARNTAITQKQKISICGYTNDNHSNYDDEKCYRDWTKLVIKSGDNIINQDVLSGSYRKVYWSAFQRKASLEFSANGFTAHQNGTLYLCHKTEAKFHRSIVVSKSGRTTVTKDTDKLNQRCN